MWEATTGCSLLFTGDIYTFFQAFVTLNGVQLAVGGVLRLAIAG